jgi:hypothetical protein
VVDRFWLPWAEKYDTVVAGGGAANRRVRHVYPGVVLFRRDTVAAADTARVQPQFAEGTRRAAPPGRAPAVAALARAAAAPPSAAPAPSPRRRVPALQLLYIVGEVPTGGVHKEAMQRALAERDAVLGMSGETDSLRIVGPSFSGGAASLEVVLERWRASHPGVPASIVTGSATGSENVRRLSAGRFQPVLAGATVHSNARLTVALVRRVLCPLGLGDDQVAVLHESGTAYGHEGTTGGYADSIPCPGSTRRMHPDRFLGIPFPMNVGSFRARLEEDARATKNGAEGQPQSRIPLVLRDPDRPGDRPAPASQLTPATIELLLDEIERAVTGHRIRAVGVVASDVRDKIFLAGELHRRLGNVQLFTFDANALYLTPENNDALRGMLVLSTYPLNLRAQWWVPGRLGGQRLSFPDDGALGIHNAVLMQLGADSLVADYGLPFLAPDTAQEPPVWISTVGREEFLPVTVSLGRERDFIRSAPAAPAHRPEWPSIPFFTAVILAALGAAVLAAVWPDVLEVLRWRRPPPVERPKPFAELAGDEDVLLDEVQWGTLPFHRDAYRAIRALALLGVFLPAALVTWQVLTTVGLFDGPGWGWRLLALAFVTAVSVAGLLATARIAVLAVREFFAVSRLGWAYTAHDFGGGEGSARRKRLWQIEMLLRLFVFAGGIAFFVSTMWMTAQIARLAANSPVSHPLFLVRATELSDGVSPLLVLLVAGAAAAAWCTWHVRRITYLRETTPYEGAWHQAPAEDKAGATALPKDAEEAVKRVRTGLFQVIPDMPGVAVGLAVVALGGVLFAQIGHTIENMIQLPAFDWILGISISGTLVAICWAVYRLLAVWRALDDFLQHLSQTPLVSAFGRLPERVAQLTRLTLWRPPSRDVIDMVSAAQWRSLRQLYRAATPELIAATSGADTAPKPPAPAPTVVTAKAGAATATITLTGGGTSAAVADASGSIAFLTIGGPEPDLSGGAPVEPAPEPDGDPTPVERLMAYDGPPASRPTRRLSAPEGENRFVLLNRVLAALWAREPDEHTAGEILKEVAKAPEESTGALARKIFPSPVRLWMRAAEEVAAVQVVDYIEWALQSMRTLTLFLFVSLLLTTALISSYPFQPQGIVKVVLLFVLLVTVGALLFVMSALNRDDVLSLIAKTDPGRITWSRDFVLNALTVGIVPIATLISAALPGWNLFGWLQPLLHAISGGG